MKTRIEVWREFGGGRKRGGGRPPGKIISIIFLHIALVCIAPPYQIQRSIKQYRPNSCSSEGGQTNKHSNRETNRNINTMTRPCLRAGPSENIHLNFFKNTLFYSENLKESFWKPEQK